MRRFFLLLTLIVLVAPVRGQSLRISSTYHDGRRGIEVHRAGSVVTTPDDRHLVRIAPGGYLHVEETIGGRSRRFEATPGPDGRPTLRYFENGRPRGLDAEAQRWIETMIEEAVLDSGIGADARMAELLRDEGVDGALAGAARYRTDGARSEALGALLVQLEERPGEAARVVRASPRLLTSDGDRASFLTHALRAVGLGTQAMRTAYFDAAGGLGSDGDWARVLVAALHDEGRRTDVVLGVIRSLGGRDRSDGDETRVLLAVPESMLGRSEVSRAYLSALRTVHSDGDRARALSRSALLQ